METHESHWNFAALVLNLPVHDAAHAEYVRVHFLHNIQIEGL